MMQFLSCNGRFIFTVAAAFSLALSVCFGQTTIPSANRTLRQCLRHFEIENALGFGTAAGRPFVASGPLCQPDPSNITPNACTYFFERERCGINPNDYICQHATQYIDREDGLDRLNVWIVPLNLETYNPSNRRITRRTHRRLPFSGLAVIDDGEIQYFSIPESESERSSNFSYYDMRLLRDLKATIYLRLAVPRSGVPLPEGLRSHISVYPAQPLDLFQNTTLYSLHALPRNQVANSNEDFLFRRLTILLEASRPLLRQVLSESRSNHQTQFLEQRNLVMNHWYSLYNQCIQVNIPQLQGFKDSMISFNEELQRMENPRPQR